MTHNAPPSKFSAKTIAIIVLTGFLSAVGTHLWDVVEVKAKVDMLSREQEEEHKLHSRLIAQLEEFSREHAALIAGQHMLNKRLCGYLVEHGAADEECTQQLWEEHEAKLEELDRQRRMKQFRRKESHGH